MNDSEHKNLTKTIADASGILAPSAIRALCAQFSLTPSTVYGQHYLITPGPIVRMLDAAACNADDTVIEIGPGFGVLTHALLGRGARVIAFEIEQTLRPYWESQRANAEHLEVVWGNVLTTAADAQYQHLFAAPYKVIANIPYQITGQLLRLFLEELPPPTSMTLMVQKEVAERICAKPGQMSILAVSVQAFGTPKIIMRVPKGNFFPAPRVDSAVIHIENIVASSREETQEFFRVVRAGFLNKRKLLVSNLSAHLQISTDRAREAVLAVCGSDRVRAQELSIAEWKRIVVMLSTS